MLYIAYFALNTSKYIRNTIAHKHKHTQCTNTKGYNLPKELKPYTKSRFEKCTSDVNSIRLQGLFSTIHKLVKCCLSPGCKPGWNKS